MPSLKIIDFTLQKLVGYLLNCGRECETHFTSKRHAAGCVCAYPITCHSGGEQGWLGAYESVVVLSGILSCPSCPADRQTAGLPGSQIFVLLS